MFTIPSRGPGSRTNADWISVRRKEGMPVQGRAAIVSQTLSKVRRVETRYESTKKNQLLSQPLSLPGTHLERYRVPVDDLNISGRAARKPPEPPDEFTDKSEASWKAAVEASSRSWRSRLKQPSPDLQASVQRALMSLPDVAIRSGKVLVMDGRCPRFIALLEGSFTTAIEAVHIAYRAHKHAANAVELHRDLSRKVEAFQMARQALMDHVNTCPRCDREGNGAL